ncbi:MAG: hypothetical protein R3286_20665 [Gammaproteobacteria bacterium]|nr:hypothetical protein [Gammaproteobacteria bacterium]
MLTARALIAAAILVAWSIPSAAAELVVISSSDASLAPGTVLDGARPLAVAEGAEVVLVSPQGRIIKLIGPHRDAPDASTPPGDGGLVDSLSQLINREAASPSTLAVFRGMLGQAPAGRPDVWGIDIARAGRYCLRPDRPVMLWWAAARPGAAVTLSREGHGDDSAGVRIRWPRGKRQAAWPQELPIADGATYLARFRPGDPGERLVTVMMPALETDAHRAAWMAEQGCTRQALAVLDALGREEL